MCFHLFSLTLPLVVSCYSVAPPFPSPLLPSPSLLALQFSQQPTAFVYCEMLRACEQRRLWLQVDELWAHMRAGGVTPDAACWQVRAAHGGETWDWGWVRELRSGGRQRALAV